MKHVRILTLASLGTTLTALLIAQGCSSSSTTETGGSSSSSATNQGSHSSSNGGTSSSSKSSTSSSSSVGGSSSGGGSSSSSAATGTGLPPQPMGAATTSTTAHNFAIHHLYVGDDDPNPMYTADPNAWKTIGYNVDGLDSTASSTNVCTPYTKGTTVQQVDGANGIDNAFASQIAPQLGLIGNLSQTVSLDIIKGSFTIEIDTTGLDGTATQTATALGGQLFAGATYTGGAAPPLTGNYFSATDNWPVSEALLTDGMTIAGGSKIKFPAAYVTKGVWVSGAPVNLGLSLSLEGESLTLTIHHAVMSFQYAANGTTGLATNGVISGVLETTEFIAAINQVVGSIQGGADCAIVSTILPLIENSQDIIIDPTTGDVSNTAGTACNGISIGLAFDADEIMPPSIVAAPVDAGTPSPPCN